MMMFSIIEAPIERPYPIDRQVNNRSIFKKGFVLRLAVPVLALVLCFQKPSHALEPAEILAWVAHRMYIAEPGPLPALFYVDKAKLQAVFKRANRNSYLRWEARFGTSEAQRILSVYLQEIVGMFDSDTKSIYVGRFLAPCRREAILAHEITHYLQVHRHGRVEPDVHDAEHIQLRWEMQAITMERRYGELFCENKDTPKLPTP